MYRESPKKPPRGELVLLRTAGTLIEGELLKAQLLSEGIPAHVAEGAGFHPILNESMGGVRVLVPEEDLSRARSVVREAPDDHLGDDGEGSDVVRCPRCELAYCYHERLRIEGSSGRVGMAFLLWAASFAFPKRWHCHKCGHIWDDPRSGPAEATLLGDSDPRPVFRLRRNHAGMGLFLGVMAAFFLGVWLPSAFPPREAAFVTAVLPIAAIVLGMVIGRMKVFDVCSEPSCRGPLPFGKDSCPTCRGVIGGVIRSAEEHYSEAAEVRRELAALHRQPEARRVRRKKGPNRGMESG